MKFAHHIGILAFLLASATYAETTDIANTPLTQAGANAVRPNLMFVLDDSGSMEFNYMPDNVVSSNMCKRRNDFVSSNSFTATTACEDGEPPFYSPQFNGSYYNPEIYYQPPVNPCDNSQNLKSMTAANTSNWTAVLNNGYLITYSGTPTTCTQTTTSNTVNIAAQYPEMIYCNSSITTNTGLTLTNANCRRNGINSITPNAKENGNANFYSADQARGDYDFPDNLHSSNTTSAATNNVPLYTSGGNFVTGAFNRSFTINGSNPHYYRITPREYCSDDTLTNCTLSTVPVTGFTVPAYVRYCQTEALANPAAVVTGNTGGQPSCNSKYISTAIASFYGGKTYTFARYGTFSRVDIVSSTTSYPKSINRSDCAGATCTYAEEMTNFANWRAYYSTRIKFMKNGAGRAFNSIVDNYKVGFTTINNSSFSSTEYLRLNTFDAAQKFKWYQIFYKQSGGGSTPLRGALANIGRLYANKLSALGLTAADDPQPEKYSCQQNFTLLTTDGYWNETNTGKDVNGNFIGNEDGTESTYIKRSEGSLDGLGSSGSLADVAAYYYKNDLRTDITDLNPAIAGLNTKDPAPHQHMTSFTLGLGLDGTLDYTPDYDTATSGDFVAIKTANKNWPIALNNNPTGLDDLWHAAVNGHGKYFSAKNPAELTLGIQQALSGIEERKAGGGAAATSAATLTSTDNAVFSTTYRTQVWTGEVTKRTIDVNSGTISGDVWNASSQMGTRGTIYTFNRSSNGRKQFLWAELDTTERAYFSTRCGELTQCEVLTTAAKALANDGATVLSYLRGTRTNEGTTTQNDKPFRARDSILGDIVNSGAAFYKAPRFNYLDSGYESFKAAGQSRQGLVFAAANDGMLHAFNAESGAEAWAYVPHAIMDKMVKLTDKAYGNNHKFFVDARPSIGDVFSGSWRSILVGGFGAGGRGYYAIDITNPLDPQPLWEICGEDPSLALTARKCNISDNDMGFSYSQPVFFKFPQGHARAGQWAVAVTSGYNNINPGDGKGYLYFLNPVTGAVLEKISTGVGSTTTINGICETAPCPSGLGRIASFALDAPRDASALYMWSGDLFGNLFKFNLTTGTTTVYTMATLRSPSGALQPITAKPVATKVKNVTEPVVFVGTGRYIGTSDISDDTIQTLYAIRDKGTPYGNPRASLELRTITRSGNDAFISGGSSVNWANGGWYVDLTAVNKERVNIDPIIFLGTVAVLTNSPGAEACSAGGTSALYQFDLARGTAVGTANKVGSYDNTGLGVGLTAYSDTDGNVRLLVPLSDGSMSTKEGNVPESSLSGKRTGFHEITNEK